MRRLSCIFYYALVGQICGNRDKLDSSKVICALLAVNAVNAVKVRSFTAAGVFNYSKYILQRDTPEYFDGGNVTTGPMDADKNSPLKQQSQSIGFSGGRLWHASARPHRHAYSTMQRNSSRPLGDTLQRNSSTLLGGTKVRTGSFNANVSCQPHQQSVVPSVLPSSAEEVMVNATSHHSPQGTTVIESSGTLVSSGDGGVIIFFSSLIGISILCLAFNCMRSMRQTPMCGPSSDPLAKPGQVPEVTPPWGWRRWYYDSHCQISGSYEFPQLDKYDSAGLTSLHVLWCLNGTVFDNAHLWIEQFVLLILHYGIIVGLILAFPRSTRLKSLELETPTETARSTHSQIQQYSGLLQTLVAFILGLYTSLTIARWWRLRTEGIGALLSATDQLTLFLSEFVTKDKEDLLAIRRYSRASLMIIFMRQRGYYDRLEILTEREILTKDEVEKLKAFNNNLAQSIWTWTTHIVAKHKKKGNIKEGALLKLLLEKCNQGRGAAALMCAQLGTPLPLHYVHFIGFLVKFHNVFFVISMSFTMLIRIDLGDKLVGLMAITKVFVIPLFYNAVLIMNEVLSNPFKGEIMDFGMRKFDTMIEGDARSMLEAGEHLPDWMSNE